MLKLTLSAALLASAFAIPAFADDAMMMKCDDASMMKMQTHMDAMGSSMKDKKEIAMKEMGMAKMSMKAHKMNDCKMHLDNAAKSMN
jgi:hypothetical protein